MGEYALYNGEQVKIGTCENLYYLRYEHRKQVQPLPNNLNPNGDEQYECRFRFPWPDEDYTAAPGTDNERHDYDRSCWVPGCRDVPRLLAGAPPGWMRCVRWLGGLARLAHA